jgi:hypothetical protein
VYRTGALSQGLTRNIGYPKLREHLGAAVAFMKISRDYHDCIDKLDTHDLVMESSTALTSITSGKKTTVKACNKRGRQLRRPLLSYL